MAKADCLDTFAKVQAILDSVAQYTGGPANAGTAVKFLREQGHVELARRVRRRCNGRNSLARPDVSLVKDFEGCMDGIKDQMVKEGDSRRRARRPRRAISR